MKKGIFILSSSIFLFSFSFDKSNPFIGSWEYQSNQEGQTSTIIFDNSSMSYFITVFGVDRIKMGSNNYEFTDKYLIQDLESGKDTTKYYFVNRKKMMLISLDLNDTMIIKK